MFSYLRDNLGEDVTTANLVIQGNQAVLVRDGGELIDLVQKGQGVLNVLALAGVVHDVDARIVELRPQPRRRRHPPRLRQLILAIV